MSNKEPDFLHEFPEHASKIHHLKETNGHFRRLYTEYQDVAKSIYRSAQRIDLLSELDEEKLRKERLRLKDELYGMLESVG